MGFVNFFEIFPRFEIKDEDGYHVLLVKDLTLADEGEITCQIGRRETKAKLMVDEGNTANKDKLHDASFFFTICFQVLFVVHVPGASLCFMCQMLYSSALNDYIIAKSMYCV